MDINMLLEYDTIWTPNTVTWEILKKEDTTGQHDYIFFWAHIN